MANDFGNRVTVLLNTTPPAGRPPPPNLDADGDGVQPPADCNDANPAIRPGASDIPGDKIDQDCTGGTRSYPLLARSIARFRATYPAALHEVHVDDGQAGAQGRPAPAHLQGPGLQVSSKKIRVKKNAGKRSLLRYLEGLELRNGAVVQLRVTRPGHDRARQHVEDPRAEGPEARASAACGRARRSSSAARGAEKILEQRGELVRLGDRAPAGEVLADVRGRAAVDRLAARQQRHAVGRAAGDDEVRAERAADDALERRGVRARRSRPP